MYSFSFAGSEQRDLSSISCRAGARTKTRNVVRDGEVADSCQTTTAERSPLSRFPQVSLFSHVFYSLFVLWYLCARARGVVPGTPSESGYLCLYQIRLIPVTLLGRCREGVEMGPSKTGWQTHKTTTATGGGPPSSLHSPTLEQVTTDRDVKQCVRHGPTLCGGYHSWSSREAAVLTQVQTETSAAASGQLGSLCRQQCLAVGLAMAQPAQRGRSICKCAVSGGTRSKCPPSRRTLVIVS